MKRIGALAAGALVLVLAGCAPAPSHDEVADRFLIEYTDNDTMRDAMAELADTIADDALAGNCGQDAYEAGLMSGGDENLFYAWRVTCQMYFEDDLTEAQIEQTKQMVIDRVSDQG